MYIVTNGIRILRFNIDLILDINNPIVPPVSTDLLYLAMIK
jgi:hypothetical protein